MTLSAFVAHESHHGAIPSRTIVRLFFSYAGIRVRACLPVACSSTGCNVLPIYMEVQQVRLPMVLLAFCLLFAFWTAAFFLHLRGGLTTYSLLVISLTLLIRTRRVTDGAFGNLTRPHRGRLIWPHLRHKNPFPPAC